MKISTIFEKKNTVFSLEVFPPKKTSGIETIYNTLDQLADLPLDFISVTYGAGGTGTGSYTAQIASDLKNKYHLSLIHI